MDRVRYYLYILRARNKVVQVYSQYEQRSYIDRAKLVEA